MKIDFATRTAIVTGAAHGFGRAIACKLAALGARVWATDILADELAETARIAGTSCQPHRLDVTDRDAIRALVHSVEQQTGRIDILVHSAGGVVGQVGRPLEEITPQDWHAIFDVNLTGAFWCAQSVVPAMKRARSGRIVTISSGAGLGVSLTGIQAYASAKAGEIGLTRQLAHELGPFGITVNSVAPGFVRSNPSSEKQWQSYGQEGQQHLIDRIALRRLGSVDDIADATLFLLSDHAGWITGQTLSVDGGK
ncbi:MAG TPA: SDR family oxidoreductase [Acetobacteraceae bacterium]